MYGGMLFGIFQVTTIQRSKAIENNGQSFRFSTYSPVTETYLPSRFPQIINQLPFFAPICAPGLSSRQKCLLRWESWRRRWPKLARNWNRHEKITSKTCRRWEEDAQASTDIRSCLIREQRNKRNTSGAVRHLRWLQMSNVILAQQNGA